MTTQTIAPTSTSTSTSTPAPATSPSAASSRTPARRAPAASVAPNPHSTSGAWILTVVTILMAITVAVSFYLASQISF